jgi:hypothetical protein
MPRYEFTSPDGNSFFIEGPEGSSVNDAIKLFNENIFNKKNKTPQQQWQSAIQEQQQRDVLGPGGGSPLEE